MNPSKRSSRGVTIIEMTIIIGIIGIVFFLTSTVIRFMNNVSRERISFESQRNVEIILNQVARDIRNSQQIATITATTLELRVFDLALGYDVNRPGNDFWNPAKIQWLIYSYESDAKGTFLRKQLLAPNKTTLIEEKQYLRNLLEPDDPATTSTVERIFSPIPASATGNFNTVQIDFRVKPPAYNIPAKFFRTEAMIRRTSES